MDIQRFAIIADDQLVIVDNYAVNIPLDIPEEIHAIQWQGGKGEIEYRDDRTNEKFTDLTPFKDVIDQHAKIKAEALSPKEPDADVLKQQRKSWRTREIYAVVQRLSQYSNDFQFGSDTFPYAVDGYKKAAALALNDYRTKLIEWTDTKDFLDTEPPTPPVFWKPLPL